MCAFIHVDVRLGLAGSSPPNRCNSREIILSALMKEFPAYNARAVDVETDMCVARKVSWIKPKIRCTAFLQFRRDQRHMFIIFVAKNEKHI
jgi:hypothetical protein